MIPLPDKILFASGNVNKHKEVKVVADRFGVEILTPKQVQEELSLSAPPEVDEVGATYIENALLKARALADWSNLITLGDDSGLEVISLGNIPGIRSARFLRDDASYPERMQYIVDNLKKLEEHGIDVSREARYYCALALVVPGQDYLTVQTHIPGKIVDEQRGSRGFGYDPIFLIESLGKTLAEVDFDFVTTDGFRAQAVTKLLNYLKSL